MEICEGHSLSIADGVVTLLGEGDPSFFERAEEVEEFKVHLYSPCEDLLSEKLRVGMRNTGGAWSPAGATAHM